MKKRKHVYNVNELNAYNLAYGRKLGTKDYFHYVGLPALFMVAFLTALTYFWWLALIGGIVGGFYGYRVILPNCVKRNYYMKSMQERNRFINNMTQIMTDKKKTVSFGLGAAKERTDGELKTDLGKLEAGLMGADRVQIKEAFAEINEKYKHDVVFTQYTEQLETAMYEGKNNIETLKEIKSYHNDTLKKQKQFMEAKNGHLRDFKSLLVIIGFFIMAITFSFGFSTYFESFARGIAGWVSSAIYMPLLMYLMTQFSKFYFDDSIMEVRVK